MANFFKESSKKSKRQQKVTLIVNRLDPQGCGVASLAKKPVFIDGALPNEIVDISIYQQNSKYAKAKLIKLVKSSSERIEVKCRHYYQCGGCNLQHLQYSAQIAFKQQQVSQLLARQLVNADLPWQEAIVDEPWHYRRKARIGVQYNKNGEPIIGFRQRESNNLTEIKSCPVLVTNFADIFIQLRSILAKLSGKNAVGHIEIVAANKNVVVVRQLTKMTKKDKQLWLKFSQQYQYEIYIDDGKQVALLVAELSQPTAEKLLSYSLSETLTIEFSVNHFIQVNHRINQKMVTQAIKWLNLQPEDVVLDLFCGLGNFTLPIAQQVVSVVGVEGVENMVTRAQENAKANGVDNCQFYQADLNSAWQNHDWAAKKYSKVLLDPARAGAYEALTQLVKSKITTLLYISCDASSLARDAKLLIDHGYKIEKIAVMDMFSQTKHVETMVLFNL